MKRFLKIIAILILPGGIIIAIFHWLFKSLKNLYESFVELKQDSSS